MLRAIIGLVGALLRLLLLVGAGLAVAAGLLVIGGPPRLPERWPSLDEVALTLQLGGVPNDALLYLLTQVLWLMLGYLALIFLLDLLAAVLDALATGVAGVARLRRTVDALAPGVVRQAVAGVVAALLTGWLSLRPVAATAVPPARPVAELVVPRPAPPAGGAWRAADPPVIARDDAGRLRLIGAADAAAAQTPGARHVVITGDNLVDLATRYYGEPAAWEAIWEANRGRTMTNGRAFDNPSLIVPGDVLLIPVRPSARPTRLVDHLVQPGDMLRALAAHYYGDERRWPVIFEANRGRPAPGNRFLADPDLIWPGMTLKIPLPAQAVAPAAPGGPVAAPDAATPAAAPAPEPAPEPPAPAAPAAPTPPAPPAASAPRAEPTAAPAPPIAAPPADHARPAVDAEREAAAARLAWQRLQAEAEAEARANAAASTAASPPPEAPAATATPADDAVTPEPVDVTPVADLPAAERRQPWSDGQPVTGDVPLAGVAAGLAALAAALGYRALRRHLHATRDDDRHRLPFHFPFAPAVDPASGLATQPLAPPARQRQRGVEADARHAVTARLLAVLERAGWPDARVLSLAEGEERLVYHLRLEPPPADVDRLADQLEDALDAMIALDPAERGAWRLALDHVGADTCWAAGYHLPPAPLATVGLAADGLRSVARDAVGGGLLVAGADALPAAERAALSLAALYPPDALAVVLLAGAPLAERLAALPHRRDAAAATDTPAAAAALRGLQETLRERQAAGVAAEGPLLLLVADRPERLDEAILGEVARDGADVGIYTLLVTTAPAALPSGLLTACPARLISRLDDAETSQRLAGQPGAEQLAPGRAWWRLAGAVVEPVRALRIAADDRAALLASMAESWPASTATTPADMATDLPGVGADLPALGADDAGPLAAAGAPLALAPAPAPAAIDPLSDQLAEELRADERDRHARAGHAADVVPTAAGDGAGADSAPGQPVLPVWPFDLVPVVAPRPAVATNGHPAADHAPAPARDRSATRVTAPAVAPACGEPPLRLQLFGSPRLYDAAGNLITFRVQMSMSWRLLLCLGAAGAAGASRDRLLAILWPEDEPTEDDLLEDDAATRLMETVNDRVFQIGRRLRATLAAHLPPGRGVVLHQGGIYRLDPELVGTDVADVEAALATARRLPDAEALPYWGAVLDCYSRPLAEGVPPEALELRWLEQQRMVYQEAARTAALRATAALARAGEYATAAAALGRLRAAAIVDDDVVQLELICQALRGERRLIAQTYQEHVDALGRVGEKPLRATVELCKALLEGRVGDELRQRLVSAVRA
ncbi:MAG: LysM peptidoglycan-binding domain-containing protein [Chloroflexi bacterium]|nr:LysM peptidoglycan-binding domain-containing protein [Chloroflexota bacterium]